MQRLRRKRQHDHSLDHSLDHEYAPNGMEPLVFRHLRDDPVGRPWYFVSVRWRAIMPVALLVIALVALGAYLIGDALAQSAQDREIERVLVASQGVADRMAELGAEQQREATRIAYTGGVTEAMQAGDERVLHPLVEPLAAAADLDVVILADAGGREIVGLQRVAQDDVERTIDYAVATGADLIESQPGLFAVGGESRAGEGTNAITAIMRTGQGHTLVTAYRVVIDDKHIGSVIVGTRVDRVLDALRGDNEIDLALYGPGGEFIRTTFTYDDSTRAALVLAAETFDQALTTPGQVPVVSLMLQNRPHNAAYIPLVTNGSALGVVGVYRADDTLYATWLSRELMAMIAALIVAGVIVVTFGAMNHFAARVERVTRTADALALGDAHARTGLKPCDEIGELGAAVDRWAERQQFRTDSLQTRLRQQRVESARLSAILESIPDGLVVQDLDGRVLLLNDAARELLGGQRVFRSARLHDLTAVVTEALGPALAPGIYALGDPTRISLDGKMLHAQAAAITVKPDKQRIGTVIVLREITDEVVREQRREELLHTLTEQALAPRSPAAYESLSTLAREVVKNTRAIQSVISELRDLSTFNPRDLESGQRPIPANNLLWHIGAEWEPLARLAKIQLRVLFGPRGLYVLGDERRLRWALGNIVDNALKFSPPCTTITLAARHKDDNDDNRIEYIVRDEGYGISPEDLPHVFTRFYRGTPRDLAGHPVRKPGTGQGLFIARRVIEAHGGDVALASRVAMGTTVIVRLPLTSAVTFDLPTDDLDEIPTSESATIPSEDLISLSEGDGDTVRLEPRSSWEEQDE